MTDTILAGLRWLHVAAGVAALVVAPVAMIAVKGGTTHRTWGKLYYRAMVVVGLTAIVLGLARPNPFLTMVAVFSFYTAFSGYRALRHKRPDSARRDFAAWTMALLSLAASLGLVALGIAAPTPLWQRLSVVAIVLGSLGASLAWLDIAAMRGASADPMRWWYAHMTRMLGSYLAAVSAFSVVNFTFLPLTARWLWPTVIGTPLIALWTAYYRRRFQRPAAATTAAATASV